VVHEVLVQQGPQRLDVPRRELGQARSINSLLFMAHTVAAAPRS
jgi:hypothetical protein